MTYSTPGFESNLLAKALWSSQFVEDDNIVLFGSRDDDPELVRLDPGVGLPREKKKKKKKM